MISKIESQSSALLEVEALLKFENEMSSLDPVTHVVLKGHLILEERLGRILEAHLFHPEHTEDARLSFNDKMCLCRSLCLRKNRLGEWELIAAVNGLRNELAHNLESTKRQRKIDRVKEIYFREAAGLDLLNEIKARSDAEIIKSACGHCEGFLTSFERDALAFRQLIHRLDRELNAGQEPFSL